jgi:hypothetical protein
MQIQLLNLKPVPRPSQPQANLGRCLLMVLCLLAYGLAFATESESIAAKQLADLRALQKEAATLGEQELEKAIVLRRQYIEGAAQVLRLNLQAGPGAMSHAELDMEIALYSHDLRFGIKDARLALSKFQAIEPLIPKESAYGRVELFVHAADLLQFELQDKKGALTYLRKAREALKASDLQTTASESDFLHAKFFWLDDEIEYLSTGRTRTAPIRHKEMKYIRYFPNSGNILAMPSPRARPIWDAIGAADEASREGKAESAWREVSGLLNQLKPSRLLLLEYGMHITAFDDEAKVNTFISRHDPSGSVSAVLLPTLASIKYPEECGTDSYPQRGVLFSYMCEPSRKEYAVLDFARRWSTERRLLPPTGPDPRFSSPEQTWKQYLIAHETADFELATECVTAGFKDQVKSRFIGPNRPSLRDFPSRFVRFGEVKEDGSGAMRHIKVHFLAKGTEYSKNVSFRRIEGEWFINEPPLY